MACCGGACRCSAFCWPPPAVVETAQIGYADSGGCVNNRWQSRDYSRYANPSCSRAIKTVQLWTPNPRNPSNDKDHS